ncbi:MAG TPA: 3-oxoacyl-ACP reductase family protein [bacterium]|nr:3-oxoacyl-ACP reductase family protein [bacterium]
MSESDLAGRVALVTGGSRGLGAAICTALARAGADVAINYLSHGAGAEAVRHEVEATGRRGLPCQADVSQAEAVTTMVALVERTLGPVDILVNNAGLIRPQPPEAITEADWDDLIDVNLKSAFLCTQAVLPGMRERRWGRIINVASLAAQVGGLVGPHYSAAKAGLLGLTHAYATTLVKEGITVNAVAPALVETDMVRNNPNARPELVPVGRFGRPEEHADVVVLLARTGYITGQTYNVNGGMYFS